MKEVDTLAISLGLFTIVALIGIALARDVFQQRASSGRVRFLHVCFAAAGAVLVIIKTFMGDQRLWVNIGLAVAIIVLGLLIWRQRSRGAHPGKLVVLHGGIAVVCYLILAYFVFTPR